MTTEERKRPQSNGSGWIATLGGALLLVAVGFGVGLVAGTAYEEPELVADHLAGRTTELALQPGLAADPIGESPGDVAAAPPAEAAAPVEELLAPLGTGVLDEAREERSARAAPVATGPTASQPAMGASPGTSFAIQVGAFGSEATAEQLAGELEKRGYRSYVTSEGEAARFKVRVGPIASRSEAEQLAERLKREHRLPTWIMAAKS